MEWTQTDTLRFLSLIKDRPAIWDSEKSVNKVKRQRAMKEVTAQMGTTVEEGFAKWTKLRSQYMREERKVLGSGTDSEAETKYKSKWFAYHTIKSFMKDYVPHKTEKDKSILQTSETPSEKSRLLTQPSVQPIAKPIVLTRLRVTSQPDNKHSTNAYPLQKLRVLRHKKKAPPEVDDDITSFTKYMAAQIRKLEPHMQSEAKLGISSLLYKYEMESMDS